MSDGGGVPPAAGAERFPLASMRAACAPLMATLGAADDRLIAMGADGQSVFTEFARAFPDRYVDVGIAEANLLGVAAGLALSGRTVLVGGIAAFLVRRAYEQLRNDVCLRGLPVKLFGVGGGLSYGALGATHHLVEDVALLRSMPNMAVFVPADAHDAVGAVRDALAWPGPAYVRLGSAPDPLVHTDDDRYLPGNVDVIRAGADVAVLAMGGCVSHAVLAVETLVRSGCDAALANVHTLRPLDCTGLRALIAGVRAVVVVEEHVLAGGLGSVVTELMEHDACRPVVRLGIDADRHPPVADHRELLAFYGLDERAIVAAARSLLPGAARPSVDAGGHDR